MEGPRRKISSHPDLWDSVEGMKERPVKVFNHDEIATYMASGIEPPKPYYWRSKSIQLPRNNSKRQRFLVVINNGLIGVSDCKEQ